MCKLRDVIIFFAGAEFFHTINHIFLAIFADFPIDLNVMVLTNKLNNCGILINAAVTILLLFWAWQLSKKH